MCSGSSTYFSTRVLLISCPDLQHLQAVSSTESILPLFLWHDQFPHLASRRGSSRTWLDEPVRQYPLVAILKAREPYLHVSDLVPERPQAVHFRLESLRRQTPVVRHLLKQMHKSGSC